MISSSMSFVQGDSQLAQLIRKKDWSIHPMGPTDSWPMELKTTVSLMLASKFPMFVTWGRDRFFLYNDAYMEILGKKHPAALGQKFEILWSEVWSELLPLVKKVESGESVFLEDLKLIVDRHHVPEEAYFTFSYSPILNSVSAVAGLFCVALETNRKKHLEFTYRDLANSMTQLAWVAKPDGFIHWYNDRWYEYTGTNFEEMQGWGWGKVHHPDYIEHVVQFVTEAWKRPEPWELTFPLRSTSGEYRMFLTRAVPLKNSAGEIVQWFGTNTDIEEQRQILERLKNKSDALAQSQDNLQFALSSAKMGTWTVEFPSGRLNLSAEAKQIVGYNTNFETTDEAFEKLIHPDDRKEAREKLAAAITLKQTYQDELRIILPHQEIRWIDSRGRAKYDQNGQPTILSGILLDITEKKMAQIKLEESELRFKNALKNARMGSWKINVPTGFLEADDYFRDFHHIPSEVDLKTATKVVAHPEDQKRVFEALQNSIVNRSSYSCEYRIKNKTGGYKWVAARGEPMYDEKKQIIAISGVAFEIEEQKQAEFALKKAKEAAEIANSTKSAFLANMSHEIRTPLAAILGFSSLLKDKSIDPVERDQYVDTIVRNGTSLTRIIDDILDLAKVEAGRLDVEEVPFSLYNLATEAVDLFKDKAKAKNIFLLLTIDETVPSQISSDPTRLRQILVNLIGNAVKFTDQGGVRVRLSSVLLENGKTKITVDVKDTGIGMTTEQKEKLFTPFTQADNSMTRKFGGTGLGLALSQRLSQALSGEISIVDARPGEGCTFSLTFIAAAANIKNHTLDPKKRSTQAQSSILQGLKILVVDDSVDNQFLVARLLENNGAQVDTALDGDEGFNKALAGAYDAVLMDLQMPKMDGYQAKFQLDQKGFKKPVIALTAHAMSDERVKTQAAGFAGHLTKPLVSDELLKTVASLAKSWH